MIGSLNKCENTESQQQKAKRKHLGVLMKRSEGEKEEKIQICESLRHHGL